MSTRRRSPDRIITGQKGCGKELEQHERLLRMFRDRTRCPEFPDGRTLARLPRQLTDHDLFGHERARTRTYAFKPREP